VRLTSDAAQRRVSGEPSLDAARLYADLRRPLLAFLRKHTGSRDVAEDVLHDVVVKALAAEQAGSTPVGNATGWLYAAARNAAMDHHRRRRVTEELPDEAVVATPDDAPDEPTLALAQCLRPLADRLPPAYRDVVVGAEFDGRRLASIAQDLDLSLSAAKTRASRGRRLMRDSLVRCCKVQLARNGAVLDYDTRAAERCSSRR
jgi:RNA polymerase sigma-70 factor (ECF subfamily)